MAFSPRDENDFQRKKHVQYFLNCLNVLPGAYSALDTNRLSLAFFAVSGLDMLGALDKIRSKAAIVDWIYSLQVISPVDVSTKALPAVVAATAAATSGGT